jgi:lambda family phage portal protein
MSRGGARPGAGRKKKADPQNASFEGSQYSLDRPAIYMASIDAKKEASAWDRMKIMKDARWCVNNSGPASRIVRGVARFAVGNGLVPQSQSADSAFNKAAEQLFEDRYANVPWAFDRAGQLDFYSAQTALVESMMVDGDVFAQLTKSEAGSPMMRFFGGEHVGDANKSEKDLFDGVRVNSENRPISYRVIPDPENTKIFTDVPAEDIIHIRRLHRLGYLRGMSWLASAVSRLQDIREALDNELASAKLNTKIGLVVETPEAGNIGLGGNLRKVDNGDGTTTKLDKVWQGVGTIQTKPGEKVSAHTFDRPNNNLGTYVEFLIREIAYSVGVSPEIIWSMTGLGGTASRAALQDADVFFGSVRLIVEQQFCVRFWRYAIWNFIKTGQLPYPGEDWFRVSFVPPQKVSVDFGRDSRALLELVRAGLLSPRAYFNALGQDVDEQTDDIIRGMAKRKKRVEEIAAEEGVELEYEEVFPPAPGSAPSAPEPAEPPDPPIKKGEPPTD